MAEPAAATTRGHGPGVEESGAAKGRDGRRGRVEKEERRRRGEMRMEEERLQEIYVHLCNVCMYHQHVHFHVTQYGSTGDCDDISYAF